MKPEDLLLIADGCAKGACKSQSKKHGWQGMVFPKMSNTLWSLATCRSALTYNCSIVIANCDKGICIALPGVLEEKGTNEQVRVDFSVSSFGS
eukprot:1161040-Pelagomonas_calceolata.AAC.8